MKILSRMLLCLMISFSLMEMPVMKAHAEMISTTQAVAEMTHTEASNTVAQFMDRADVKEKLMKLGISGEEATKRLASLSDKEVKKLANDINTATIGGDIGGILVLVLLVVLIIYLVKRI